MKSRTILRCSLAAALCIFASSVFAAPQKVYDLLVCVGKFANTYKTNDPLYDSDPTLCRPAQAQLSTALATIPTPIDARVFNLTPPTANSTISSIDLFVDVKWQVLNQFVGTVDKRVQVLDNSGKWKADVSTTSHLKIANLAPVKPDKWVTVRFYVNDVSCGDGGWDVTAYTGSGFTGDTFGPETSPFVKQVTSVACAQLNCNQGIDSVQPQGVDLLLGTNSPKFIDKLYRGNNQDGPASCSNLYVYQTPISELIRGTLTVTSLVTVWDKNLANPQPAVFRYGVNLEPTAGFETTESKLSQMRVAWLPISDTNPAPDFQSALFCEGGVVDANSTPFQYTKLVEDNGDRIKVEVPTHALPPVPFSIMIQRERLLVTKINDNNVPNTWTVTRNTGGTSPPASPYASGTLVMSTPFPIATSANGYSGNYLNKIVPICVQKIDLMGTDSSGLKQFRATVVDGSFDPVRIGGF